MTHTDNVHVVIVLSFFRNFRWLGKAGWALKSHPKRLSTKHFISKIIHRITLFWIDVLFKTKIKTSKVTQKI